MSVWGCASAPQLSNFKTAVSVQPLHLHSLLLAACMELRVDANAKTKAEPAHSMGASAHLNDA